MQKHTSTITAIDIDKGRLLYWSMKYQNTTVMEFLTGDSGEMYCYWRDLHLVAVF